MSDTATENKEDTADEVDEAAKVDEAELPNTKFVVLDDPETGWQGLFNFEDGSKVAEGLAEVVCGPVETYMVLVKNGIVDEDHVRWMIYSSDEEYDNLPDSLFDIDPDSADQVFLGE